MRGFYSIAVSYWYFWAENARFVKHSFEDLWADIVYGWTKINKICKTEQKENIFIFPNSNELFYFRDISVLFEIKYLSLAFGFLLQKWSSMMN